MLEQEQYSAEKSYDANSVEYVESKKVPFRRFEMATFSKLLQLAGIRSAELSGDKQSILDVACGDGFFTRMLPSNLKILGIDVSLKMVELASSKSSKNINFLHYDGSKFDSPEFSEILQKLLSPSSRIIRS